MHIYLPIAELSANVPWLLVLGGITGIFAGMLGIGGGFILTPILMLMGIPSAVAVATSTNMIVASSFSGFLSHQKHKRVDVVMGGVLVIGGFLGVLLGGWWFAALKRVGQSDLIITLLYVSLLSIVSYLMGREAYHLYHAHRHGKSLHAIHPLTLPRWIVELPLQYHFALSNVTHSLILPIAVGMISGLLVALMGVGGGFLMVPAMIYILRMPIPLTVGTSLFQIIFITAFSTLMHAITTHTVDMVLAALLLMGSTIGTQWGIRIAQKAPLYQLRIISCVLLALVALRLAYGLFITPQDIFTFTITGWER